MGDRAWMDASDFVLRKVKQETEKCVDEYHAQMLDFSCEPKMNTREARKRLDALLARMDKG